MYMSCMSCLLNVAMTLGRHYNLLMLIPLSLLSSLHLSPQIDGQQHQQQKRRHIAGWPRMRLHNLLTWSVVNNNPPPLLHHLSFQGHVVRLMFVETNNFLTSGHHDVISRLLSWAFFGPLGVAIFEGYYLIQPKIDELRDTSRFNSNLC